MIFCPERLRVFSQVSDNSDAIMLDQKCAC